MKQLHPIRVEYSYGNCPFPFGSVNAPNLLFVEPHLSLWVPVFSFTPVRARSRSLSFSRWELKCTLMCNALLLRHVFHFIRLVSGRAFRFNAVRKERIRREEILMKIFFFFLLWDSNRKRAPRWFFFLFVNDNLPSSSPTLSVFGAVKKFLRLGVRSLALSVTTSYGCCDSEEEESRLTRKM